MKMFTLKALICTVALLCVSATYSVYVYRHMQVEGDLDLYNTTGNPEITFLESSDPEDHRAILSYSYGGNCFNLKVVKADLTGMNPILTAHAETNNPTLVVGRTTSSLGGTGTLQVTRPGNLYMLLRNTAGTGDSVGIYSYFSTEGVELARSLIETTRAGELVLYSGAPLQERLRLTDQGVELPSSGGTVRLYAQGGELWAEDAVGNATQVTP